MRAIDADALIEDIRGHSASYFADDFAHEWVDKQPTIDPERNTGRWIDHAEEGYVECPFCHSATNCDGNISELHFCFSCGARMEENNEAD